MTSRVEAPEVSLECPQHERRVIRRGGLGEALGQSLGGDRNGGERRAQIVHDEGEMFLAALLQLDRFLRGVGFHGHADGPVEHAIEDAGGAALQNQPVKFHQILEGIAQNVVFRDHFRDVEAVIETLQPMRRRAAPGVRFGDPLVVLRFQSIDQLVDKGRDMIVERRQIEMLGAWQEADVAPPLGEQFRFFGADERGDISQGSHAVLRIIPARSQEMILLEHSLKARDFPDSG